MKIAVASEHRGFKAKDKILAQLKEMRHDALDFRPTNDEMCDCPDYAAKAARAVSEGEIDREILIGGTGIGMSIVANKFRGIRAALCHDNLLAQMSRRHNDANILCLSVDLLGHELAARMIATWVITQFEGGYLARRNAKIAHIEQDLRNGNGVSVTESCRK